MVDRTAFTMSNAPTAGTSYQDAVKRDRELRKAGGATGTVIRLAIGGNSNVDHLAPALRVGLAAEGFGAEVRSTAYGNWVGDSYTAPEGAPDDVWLVWLSGLGATRGLTERSEMDVAGTAAAAQRLLARGAKVVVVLPEALPPEDDPFSPFVTWRRRLLDQLRAELPPAVVQLSVEHLQRRRGSAAWTATRYWEQAKLPAHPDAMTAVGFELAAVVARLMRPAVRAVVVDLDDTMWGGIVGEVGPEALELDPDGSGRPFIELQRLLLDVMDRGVPVAVVSKNDPDVARRPFVERPEMLLKLDSFVRFDASWNPKYQAIAAFAKQLNIGIDAVCFLDDSPKERDEAREMLPGLIVPELSESPARRVEQLLQSRVFLAPVVSEEDRLRVAFFKEAHAPAPADLDKYLANLGMTLEATRIDASNSDRALSLLHKTNQFNLSLWRPAPGEFAAFVADPVNYAYAFRLKDRVTDAGVISVLMARRDDRGVRIQGWVLSCRVFNRGVEWASAEHLSSWIERTGPATISAPFTIGPRNGLIPKVLLQIGLQPEAAMVGSAERITYTAPSISPPAHHITIIER